METSSRVERTDTASSDQGDDLLWRHLKTVPSFRALLRAVEARFYQKLELPGPVLDIGCGDGHFSEMSFTEPVAVGVDPWWGPLNKAKKTGMYGTVVQCMGNTLPFPDEVFASAFSNSVLEHIPDVEAVLAEASRVMQPGGRLVITMPSHLFTEWLGGAALLKKIGLSGLAEGYRKFFNFISRHVHTDGPSVWATRLANAGFEIERWQYYFSREALQALEWGHVQGLPSAILHALTGHWIVAPWKSNLERTEKWLRPFYQQEAGETGAYILLVARKKGSGPVEATLPEARPFTLAELESEDMDESDGVEGEDAPAVDPLIVVQAISARRSNGAAVSTGAQSRRREDVAEEPEPELDGLPEPTAQFPFVPAIMAALAFLFAAIGQSILERLPTEPGSGIRWYLLGIFMALVLAWRSYRAGKPGLFSGQWPGVERIPRRRAFYFLALLLALMANGAANGVNGGRPATAILLWLTSAAVAFYSLNKPDSARWLPPVSRFGLVASVVLFLTALLVRLLDLTGHPFILNGLESSIGVDVQSVIKGGIGTPFGTGWLTNPTLPLFILAIPGRIFGPSVLAIRVLSPLVGAATVVLTFWVGSHLWNRTVGLLAAVLLLGSHFHLHYSRLGMINIWDPMLVLLALGLLGNAWRRRGERSSRVAWLLAGIAIGLNAYFFTSIHLFPIMLAALLLLGLLFERNRLLQQWHHLLACGALALIISMPQLLYYNNEPDAFMERANALGIFEGQSGWLSQESDRTGQSEMAVLRQHFLKSVLAFNYGPDKSPAFRSPIPLLGFGPAIFFVFGLVFAILHFRQFRYGMLLIWFTVTVVLAGAMLIESPSSHRLIIVAPALSLLAAIALSKVGDWVASLWQKDVAGEAAAAKASQAILPILLAIAIFFSLGDMLFYFGRYQNQNSFGDRNTEIADKMADYLNSLEGEWTAYFYGPPSMYVGFPTLEYLVTDFEAGVNLHDVLAPEAELPPTQGENSVYIFLPERTSELEQIRVLYPMGQLRTFEGFFANPLFHIYEVNK